MVTSKCEICGAEITRNGSVPGRFCSRGCAAEHRRTWKPVTREWLYQKYVIEQLGTTKIARLVGRDPKRVYEWLVDLGIPLREKWQGNIPPRGKHQDPEWLKVAYEGGKNTFSIAEELGISPNTVLKYLRRFGIQTRTTHESVVCAGKTLGVKGERNGMFGRRGSLSPTWKGGITPERQAFYETREWAEACLAVWRRDDATCQRCGKRKTDESEKYCVHHIVSFAVKELRAEPPNLILLCDPCHTWVHSRANTNHDFIKERDR